jgi:ankyrin repeat protein
MNILRACDHGDLETVKEMVKKDPSLVHAKNNYEWTPLHYASVNGHLAMVEFLVANGADVNTKDRWGNTPLIIAACKRNLDEVAKYLEKQPVRVVFLVLCHYRVFSHDLVRSLFTYFI